MSPINPDSSQQNPGPDSFGVGRAVGDFAQLADELPSMVWTCDSTGRADYFNARWYELTGQTPEEAKYWGWSEIIHPDDQARAMAEWDEAVLGLNRYEIELRYRMADGTYRWHQVRGMPVIGDAGNASHWFGISTDVEESHAKEEASAALTQAIVETAVDAIITINEQGLITFCNPATERLFGYKASEIVGQNVKKLMPEPYHSEHDGYIANYLRTGEKKIIGIGREVVGKRKDGSTFPMELAVSEVESRTGRIFTGIVRDITDRKQTEAAIVESRRQLSILISNLPGAAFRCLIDDNWTMEFISKGCLELTGHSVAEITNSKPSWAQLMHPDDFESTRKTIHDSLAERERYHIEYRIWNRNGEVCWLWEQGQAIYVDDHPVAIEGFVTDITEQRRTEDALRDSEQHYRTVVETAGSVVILMSHENRILEWNSAAEQLLGYTCEDVLGQSPFEFLVDANARDTAKAVAKDAISGNSRQSFEVPLRARDGSKHTLLWNVAPLIEANGQSSGFYSVGQDITALKAAQEKLLQSERLAAIGQMLSATAHESRNALQRIQMGLDMLDLEIKEGSESRRDLDAINHAKNDLLKLFEDQRSYAAPIHLNRSSHDLSQVWRQAWSPKVKVTKVKVKR